MTTHRITAIVINYNGIGTVLDTISSLLAMDNVHCQVVVIDDGSTDGSPEAIQKEFPMVNMECEPRNTRHLNRLRNKGLALSGTRYVLVTDNDVRFEPDCVVRMLTVMQTDDLVAACIPRLMFMGDEQRIYAAGGAVHYIGATIAPNRGFVQDIDETPPRPAVGGGIALFDMKKLKRIGLFDEGYKFAWGCDGELYQRLLLAGYKCLLVPDAIAYHEYKPFDRSRHYRARGQLSNRWRFIITHYSLRTLFMIIPALVVYEIIQAGFYMFKGIPHIYILGTMDAIRDFRDNLRQRQKIQPLREVGDCEIIFAGPIYIESGRGLKARFIAVTVRVINYFFASYWRLIQPVLNK